jgi:hypothetical protein
MSPQITRSMTLDDILALAKIEDYIEESCLC